MEMSERGIEISLDLAQEISDEINSELRGLLGEMLDQIPDEYKDLNLNSTKQVATLMREVFDVEDLAGRTAKKKEPSYKQEDLQRIYEKTGIEFMRQFSDYKTVQSLTKKLEEIVNACDSNGYIHPAFSFADTNRISYSKPGVSNCNDRVRSIIIPPDGYKMIKCDYKAQEVYILANMLNIKVLKDIFKNYTDFYTGVVKEALGIDLKKEYRANMKTAWLAGVYGSHLNGIMFIDEEEKKIAHDLRDFANTIPEIQEYRRFVLNEYVRNRKPVKSYFGSERELQLFYFTYVKQRNELKDGEEFKIEKDEQKVFNIAFNNVFQITGADMLFFAVEEFHKRGLNPEDITTYMSIHDELIFVVKEELANEETANLLTDIMQLKIEGWDLIKVKTSITDRY